MRLEITTTPRETQVWAPTPEDAAQLRHLLKSNGHVVRRAHVRELSFFASIPDDERHVFDPARILSVEIGAEAYDSLTALIDAGHELRWHRWQSHEDRDTVWGIPVRHVGNG